MQISRNISYSDSFYKFHRRMICFFLQYSEQCSVTCFKEKFKWLIFEENSHQNGSDAIKLLERSLIFIDAAITYLDLDEPMELSDGFESFYFYIFLIFSGVTTIQQCSLQHLLQNV